MKRDPLPTWRTVLGGYLKARVITWIRSYAYRRNTPPPWLGPPPLHMEAPPPWQPPGPMGLPKDWPPPGLLPPRVLSPSYITLYEQRGGVSRIHYCQSLCAHHNVTTANGDPVCCCGYDPVADMHVPRPRNTMEADRLVRSHVNQYGAAQ